jgi:hypothetical protein
MKNFLHSLVVGSVFCVVFQTVSTMEAQTLSRGPYLQNGSSSAVSVRWKTSSNANSVVRWGTVSGSLTQALTNLTLKTSHELRITGLAADTKYYYSVGTTTATLASGTGYFVVTAPTNARPTRIWVLGDGGTGTTNQTNVRTAYYNYTGSKHTDLWLMLGDNAYNDGTDAEYQAKLFNVYTTMLRKSVLWSTLGNHDGHSADSATQTGPYYNIHTFPKNGEAGGLASGTEAYYSFNYGNIHFVCLNSYDVDRSSTGTMANWLRNDLANNTKDWLIAFFHHPPYSRGSHDSDVDIELKEMRANILPILEDNGVDLVLSGHSHSYERSKFLNGHYGLSGTLTSSMIKNGGSGRTDGTGAYTKTAVGPVPNQGAVYVVAGASGKISGGALNHPAMFVSLNVLGSMVIDVDNNRLDAKYPNDNGVIRDYFTLLKGSDTRTTVTVDNSNAGFSVVGTWSTGTSAADKYGSDYRFRNTQGVSEPATWAGNLTGAGTYSVQAWWSAGSNRSTTAPYIVYHSAGSTTANVNQQGNGGKWNVLGAFSLSSGANQVKLSCWTTTGFVVIADAVRWLPQ